MKIQPRQQLLEIWRAMAQCAYDGEWLWHSRVSRNSISDAEQLLCLLYPATVVPDFKIDLPDQTAEDVLRSLRPLGDAVEIPRLIVKVLTDYLRTYTSEAGTQIFSGGSYFSSAEPGREPTAEQIDLDVVDSYSMSITLTLATIGFARVFRGVIRRPELRRAVEELETLASARLTAAMVGLLRSFSVNVFAPDSQQGRTLCRTVNQAGSPERLVVEDLQKALREVRAGIRDFTIGSGQTSELDNDNLLFECGWSWGVVKDAPRIDTPIEIGEQPPGRATAEPYLYFTVIALDGIADLFSERTIILGLLNEEQLRLAQALRLRWELTQRYWAIIGSFGQDRWPLEDIPWRTTDGEESDYFSLLITSMVVQDLVRRRATDAELRRLASIFEELGERGRITRRALDNDPAVRLHDPGVRLGLAGSEGDDGPRLSWLVSDFSAVLLKRAVRVAAMARSTELRSTLLTLIDEVWEHLLDRRLQTGPARNLWDQPGNIFAEVKETHELPSWYFTERIVECLVAAAHLIGGSPLRSGRLSDIAADLLSEAEHLFDFELLSGSPAAGPSIRDNLQRVQANLQRARELLKDRPGTAMSLAGEVLLELDRLNVARRDAAGAS